MLAKSLLVCSGLLLLGACSGGSSTPTPGQRCGAGPACQAPAYCDPVRLVCVSPDAYVRPRNEAGIPIDGPIVAPGRDGQVAPGDGPVQPTGDGPPPTCKTDETWCGTRCVNTRINLQHCGGCNNSCGPMSGSHARCNEGTCECYQPWENCDGNWPSNGCECGTGCDGTACKVSGCDPAAAGSCGTQTNQYCSPADRICKVCDSIWQNCDLVGSCECKITSYSCIDGKCQ